jgi:hypothetical protein
MLVHLREPHPGDLGFQEVQVEPVSCHPRIVTDAHGREIGTIKDRRPRCILGALGHGRQLVSGQP